MSPLEVVAARPEHADALVAFFEASGSTCFCRYWHFAGDKNAWLERAAFSPEAGQLELRGALAEKDDSAHGLCAFAGDDIVGWLKLAPLTSLPKLRNLNVYRRLDLDEKALAIGCILVRPDHRSQGVSAALIRGAVEHARSIGAHKLCAFPRRAEARLHDEEAWMGPYSAYLAEGFVEGPGEDPYPVLVHALT